MNLKKICRGCFREKPEAGVICPHCGFDEIKYELERDPEVLPLNAFLQGKYLIGKCLGRGGFGITYMGWHVNLETVVAIKEFFPSGIVSRDTGNSDRTIRSDVTMVNTGATKAYRKSLDGFIKEAKTLGGLRLPGVVRVHDFFEENRTAYIVMDYVEGQNLSLWLKQSGGRLPEAQVLKLIRPLTGSLQKLHEKGIIHRDISPDNLILQPDGSIMLVDFGAARTFMLEQEAEKAAQSMTVVLKPGYAPMEQYSSHGNQGPWTDVYAFCATVFRMLTGAAPADPSTRSVRDNDQKMLRADLESAGVSQKTIHALIKGMELRPQNRYQSMSELEEALYGTKETGRYPSKPGGQGETDKKTNKGLILAILAGAIVLAAAAIGLTVQSRNSKRQGATERVSETKLQESSEKMSEPKSQEISQNVSERESERTSKEQVQETNHQEPERVTEKQAEASTEHVTEKQTEAPTEHVTEKQTEAPAEHVTEKQTEAPTEHVTEKQTEAPTEHVTEKQTEVQTERIVLLEDEQSVGTYRAGDGGIIIWTASDKYEGDEDSLRHIEEAAPYEVPAGCMFAVDKVAAFQFEKWYHTDYYGIKGWIKWDGTCSRISKENLSALSGENVLLIGSENGIPVGNEAGQQDQFDVMLPSGTVASIADIEKGWGFVFVGQDTKGWVNMNYVCPIVSEAVYQVSDSNAPVLLQTGTVPEAEQLTEIPGGTTLYVSEIQNGYGKTACAGMTGWVKMSDLILLGDETALSTQGLEMPGEEITVPQGDWHNNLLKEEHGAEGKKKSDGSWPDAKETVFGVSTWIRAQILGVAVQDTLEGVPENAVDISQEGNGSVKGWLDGSQTLHIAGNGGVMAPANSAALFAYMENVRSADLRGLHTDNTTDLSFLFYHCDNLESVNLEGIVTDNVTDFTRMFTGCNVLRGIDLSGFNTQKVGSYAAMFQNCSSLQELDLTAFNTQSATTFWMMFRGCSNLRSVYWNPRIFVTDHVTNMSLMFYECSSLSYVDVSEFNLANVKEMDSAFFGCYSLTGLDTSRWNMSNIDDIAHLFGNCSSLTWIDTGRWNLKASVDRTEIFVGSGLEKYGPNGETLFG